MPESQPRVAGGSTTPRRVFIHRPDNLGDVVLFSGALRHIRNRFPGAEITLCVRRYALPLVELCPYVDRAVAWEDLYTPLPRWVPYLRGRGLVEAALRWARIRELGRQDVVLAPLRSPTPAVHHLVRLLGGRASYGFSGGLDHQSAADDRRQDEIYAARVHLAPEQRGLHELETTAEFLRLIGVEARPAELTPELWTSGEDRAWAERHVTAAEGSRLVGLAPGVTAPLGKLYPPEKFAQALALLAPERLTVALFGGPSESELCARAAELLRALPNVVSVVDLAGRSEIRQMVEGVRRCELFLAPDAAPLHVAVALGRPSVGVLGGGHYGRFQPWGDPRVHRICHLPMECFGCNWSCRYEVARCVQEIRPEAIAAQLADLLRATRPGESTPASELPGYTGASAGARALPGAEQGF